VNRKFWLITFAAVLSASLTISLGLWQLSRAAQKQTLQMAMDNNAHLPEMTESELTLLPDPMRAFYRPVEVRGRWETARTVFLDNRPMAGKVGFYVVTPLRLEGTSAVVLVQRGWVQRNFVNREAVPAIQPPSGLVKVVGRLAPPPAKLYELGRPGAGIIRQNLDISEFGLESGLSLMPVSIQQMGAATDGLVRDWPQASAGVEKHHGYAFQWFGLSILIAVLYVWFQIGRRFFTPRSEHVSAEIYE
jgi:surfeit locus 1 family protein